MENDHEQQTVTTSGIVSAIVPYRDALARLLRANERWLSERVLLYARRQGYGRHKASLAEALRLSIHGLSASMLAAVERHRKIPEIEPDGDRADDPVSQFAIAEARRHRSRGLSLPMLIGLYKHYKQAYADLLDRALFAPQERVLCMQFIGRVFDCIDIAFSVEWTSHPLDRLVSELEVANRALTNEKDAFLTVFESLRTPVILLEEDDRIWMVNYEASRLVDDSTPCEAVYPEGGREMHRQVAWQPRGEQLGILFPWLPPYRELLDEAAPVDTFECSASISGQERTFEGRVSRLLDVEDKVIGRIIVLNDVSEHKALTDRLERLARTDALTGTNNRRSFIETAKNEVRRASRHARQLSVLAIDVDYFKSVNDHHGHDVGDQVLVSLTQAVQTTLRATDTLGRLGGEEFAILLPETSQAAAAKAGERVRSSIAGMCVQTAAGPLQVTASLGAATLSRGDRSFEDLLRRADRALYQAKSAGRNRVVVAEASLSSEEQVTAEHFERPSGVIPRCTSWDDDGAVSALEGGAKPA